MTDPCWCPAYPFPHRPGGGRCKATGTTTCPDCGAILNDEQVEWALYAAGSYYFPPEYIPVLREPCGRCNASGAIQ